MSRTITRAAALAAAVSLSFAGTMAVAATASADEAVNPGSPAAAIVHVAPTPVHPQPVITGHEGDVLMQVNVAMPAKVVKQAKGKKRGR